MTDEPDMTPATRHDLAIWAGAIIAKVQAQMNAMAQQMSADIARHARANAEELKAHMNALMEPSKNVPARITTLEELPSG